MRGPESIIDVDVTQGSQSLCELLVVGLFAFVETEVLEQKNVSRLHFSDESGR